MRIAPLILSFSSVRRSIDASTASTLRTMNGSVNSTWPIRMKTQLFLRSPQPPKVTISASAVASPGIATGITSSSSIARASPLRLRAST